MDRASAVKAAIMDCIEIGVLVEYLEKYASEVLNMLLQEWKIEDAKVVWQKEAEARERAKWQSVVADKDATWQSVVADKDATWQSVVADKDATWQSVVADKDAIIAELRAKLNKDQ